MALLRTFIGKPSTARAKKTALVFTWHPGLDQEAELMTRELGIAFHNRWQQRGLVDVEIVNDPAVLRGHEI